MYLSSKSSAEYLFRGSFFQPSNIFSEQKSELASASRFKYHNFWGRKLTGQVGVIVLHIPAAGLVEDAELFLVGLGDVTEVLLVRAVHLLGVGAALAVAQVVPVGGGQGDLQVLDLLGGDKASKVLELVNVGAADVLDLARAEHALTRLVAGLNEGTDIGRVRTEDLNFNVGDLLETLETREERSPEHYMRKETVNHRFILCRTLALGLAYCVVCTLHRLCPCSQAPAES